jgi:hypothetical protein
MAGGVKNVSPPFQFFSGLAVTGASVVSVSSASSILYKDNIGLQYSFTGNTSGQIDIQLSNDYNPGQPQTAGQSNAGTWTAITQTSPNTIPVVVGSGTQTVFVNLTQMGASYIRTQWTNSSGSGTITGVFTAKSLG